jgi:PhnB protein
MRVNPYLLFHGECEAAFQFYAQCLGARIEFMLTFEGSSAAGQVPPEWLKKIIHARLSVGDTILMGSDCPPDRYKKPEGISVTLQIDKPAEAERVFHALAANGTVIMPIQETFWAVRYGMLTDQFGIPWMVNCEQPK